MKLKDLLDDPFSAHESAASTEWLDSSLIFHVLSHAQLINTVLTALTNPAFVAVAHSLTCDIADKTFEICIWFTIETTE